MAFKAVYKSHMSFCYWQANQPLVSCLDEDAHLPEPFVSSWHLVLAAKEVVRGEVTEREIHREQVSRFIFFVLKDSLWLLFWI